MSANHPRSPVWDQDDPSAMLRMRGPRARMERAIEQAIAEDRARSIAEPPKVKKPKKAKKAIDG